MLQFVDSQEEFNAYGKYLDKYTSHRSFNMWFPTRSLMFQVRYGIYSALFNRHFKIPFNFFRPGLEVKFACEEAKNVGANLQFLGAEFNQITWNRLYHETRTTLASYIWNACQYVGHYNYQAERSDVINRMHNSEPSQFTEQCVDSHLINWYIQNVAIFFPRLKQIFVDQRDQDLFKSIDKS